LKVGLTMKTFTACYPQVNIWHDHETKVRSGWQKSAYY
jgi:hypothetical protein